MTSANERHSATRTKILNAGIAVWADQSASVLVNGFTVARIATAANITRSTFYAYWPSTEEYVADLATHLIELDTMNYPSIVANLPIDIRPRSAVTDIPQAIVESCRAHFEAAINDESFGLRLAFLSKADDPAIAAALRDLYRKAEAAQYAPFLSSLERWGRE
jgi:AcrR family transcriptional regulator